MSVTVIVVNWNSGSMLEHCLQLLGKQSVLPDRILVIDNASTDGSAEVAVQLGAELIQQHENIGFAAANNLALSMVDSKFVALLNPDAFPDFRWLENLLDAAKKYPDFAVFASRQLCVESPDVLDGAGDDYHISGMPGRRRFGQRQTAGDLVSVEVFSACAAAAMYRLQALKDVGGFDEKYFCYVEDVDLGFRLRIAGRRTKYIPAALVHHVGSASAGGRHSDFSVYHGHRNLVWTYVKNMPGILFWLFLPFHVLLNLLTIFVYSWRGQGRVILRAKRDAIKGLPRAWVQRKQIQTQRVASIRDIWRVLNKRLIPCRVGC